VGAYNLAMTSSEKESLDRLRKAKEAIDGSDDPYEAMLIRMESIDQAAKSSSLNNAQIGEVFGISRERVRQIRRDYRQILKEQAG